MSDNLMFVTQPDLYLADQESILFISKRNRADSVCQLLGTSTQNRTVYWATSTTNPEWVITAGNLATYVVIDFQENLFYSGIFIDKAKCWYYNSPIDLNRININQITTAEEFVVKLLENEQANG